jgi:hypothetical protein
MWIYEYKVKFTTTLCSKRIVRRGGVINRLVLAVSLPADDHGKLNLCKLKYKIGVGI